jgi:predicted dehydrogenase
MTNSYSQTGSAMKKLGVGIYGMNGHQVHHQLKDNPSAELIATAGCDGNHFPGVRQYGSLTELLADPQVELVSLCSPVRRDQACEAVQCLRAGKHVYGEKPSALTEGDLDAILETAAGTGRQYHEMAGTLVEQPYREMRRQISTGVVGEVIQVLAQKSYPWHDRRPADESVDGGLSLQVGVYLARFVEHIAGARIASLDLVETKTGNPGANSDCRMAASVLIRLENGGVASGVCNYFNPMGDTLWGYEMLRVFGTKGIIECSSEGPVGRLLVKGAPPQPLDFSTPSGDYFQMFIDSLRGGPSMPMDLDAEVSPTRWVIRAKEARR